MSRSARGWGPFSGGQLTMIVCVIVAAVAFPVAASAVAGSNVFVADAVSGKQAKVDANRNLAVGDGLGPLTVDGTVNSRAAIPTKPVTVLRDVGSNSLQDVYGPASKAFAIGSITMANVDGASSGTLVQVYSKTVSSAGVTSRYLLFVVHVGNLETTHLDFPVPIVVTPPVGATASLQVFSASGVHFTAIGYQT